MYVNFNILNQLGSPSLNSNTFANRPVAGQTGRLFISTDTFEIYRDNGTGWDLIGTGTGGGITGSGTSGEVTYWTGSSAVSGDSAFVWNTGTANLEIDGNISIRTPASAWQSVAAVQIFNSSFSGAGNSPYVSGNAYYDGSNWKYISNGTAQWYTSSNGSHTFARATSGTAGNTISWITSLIIDDNSRLGVNTSPSSWLSNYKVVQLPLSSSLYSQDNGLTLGIVSNSFLNNVGAGSWEYYTTGVASRYEQTGGTHSFYAAASGTSPNAVTWNTSMILSSSQLNLSGSLWPFPANTKSITINARNAFYSTSSSGPGYIGYNAYYDGTTTRSYTSNPSGLYEISNTHTFRIGASVSANTVIPFTTALTIASSANVLIGTTTDSGGRLVVAGGNTSMSGSGTTSSNFSQTNFDSAATRLFAVRNDGSICFGNTNSVLFYPIDASSRALDKNGLGLALDNTTTTTSGTYFVIQGSNVGLTSSSCTISRITKGFAPTSGTALYSSFTIDPTINQTGGANGITRGVWITPTITAAADYRAVEMSNNSGWAIYQSGASALNYFNGEVLIGTTTDSNFKLDVSGSTRLNGTIRVDGQRSATAGGASGQHLIINCDGTTYKIALLNN